MNITDKTILTTQDSISTIILGELRSIIYEHSGSAYIKFLNIIICIEFLGACIDNHPFNEDTHSKDRFNDALIKLFNKKYSQFAKSDNPYYLYEQLRCPFIHRLKPSKLIALTHRAESIKEGTKHLTPTEGGLLVLVLEDFFEDLEKACGVLIEKQSKKKLPTKKMDEGFIALESIRDNGK